MANGKRNNGSNLGFYLHPKGGYPKDLGFVMKSPAGNYSSKSVAASDVKGGAGKPQSKIGKAIAKLPAVPSYRGYGVK